MEDREVFLALDQVAKEEGRTLSRHADTSSDAPGEPEVNLGQDRDDCEDGREGSEGFSKERTR